MPEPPAPGIESYAEALAEGVAQWLGPWVASCVETAFRRWSGPVSDDVRAVAAEAGERAAADVVPRLRALLATDIDEQRSTPLSLVRGAVAYATDALDALGVPPPARSRGDAELFPDDRFGLTPASLAELSPELGQLGLAWGAAKAWEHRRRHG